MSSTNINGNGHNSDNLESVFLPFFSPYWIFFFKFSLKTLCLRIQYFISPWEFNNLSGLYFCSTSASLCLFFYNKWHLYCLVVETPGGFYCEAATGSTAAFTTSVENNKNQWTSQMNHKKLQATSTFQFVWTSKSPTHHQGKQHLLASYPVLRKISCWENIRNSDYSCSLHMWLSGWVGGDSYCLVKMPIVNPS